MPAQIRHIAIVSERYTLLARFYEAVFGMWTFPGRVEAAAMAVSDGHVGLNFNLRPPVAKLGSIISASRWKASTPCWLARQNIRASSTCAGQATVPLPA